MAVHHVDDHENRIQNGHTNYHHTISSDSVTITRKCKTVKGKNAEAQHKTLWGYGKVERMAWSKDCQSERTGDTYSAQNDLSHWNLNKVELYRPFSDSFSQVKMQCVPLKFNPSHVNLVAEPSVFQTYKNVCCVLSCLVLTSLYSWP